MSQLNIIDRKSKSSAKIILTSFFHLTDVKLQCYKFILILQSFNVVKILYVPPYLFRNSYQAEPLAKWVTERSGVPVRKLLCKTIYIYLLIFSPFIDGIYLPFLIIEALIFKFNCYKS